MLDDMSRVKAANEHKSRSRSVTPTPINRQSNERDRIASPERGMLEAPAPRQPSPSRSRTPSQDGGLSSVDADESMRRSPAPARTPQARTPQRGESPPLVNSPQGVSANSSLPTASPPTPASQIQQNVVEAPTDGRKHRADSVALLMGDLLLDDSVQSGDNVNVPPAGDASREGMRKRDVVKNLFRIKKDKDKQGKKASG